MLSGGVQRAVPGLLSSLPQEHRSRKDEFAKSQAAEVYPWGDGVEEEAPLEYPGLFPSLPQSLDAKPGSIEEHQLKLSVHRDFVCHD